MKIHVIDTRDLEPPQPLERILGAIQSSEPGTILCMRHRFEPVLLYSFLENLSYDYRCLERKEGWFDIFIWRQVDKILAQELEARKFSLDDGS